MHKKQRTAGCHSIQLTLSVILDTYLECFSSAALNGQVNTTTGVSKQERSVKNDNGPFSFRFVVKTLKDAKIQTVALSQAHQLNHWVKVKYLEYNLNLQANYSLIYGCLKNPLPNAYTSDWYNVFGRPSKRESSSTLFAVSRFVCVAILLCCPKHIRSTFGPYTNNVHLSGHQFTSAMSISYNLFSIVL